jgi:anti-sigma regulatory factor (Ser/Thr protein kinase)
MDADLIANWLGADAANAIDVIDAASVAVARELVRERANEAGLGETETAALAIVASELANNHLAHAGAGRIAARVVLRAGVPGVEIVAADEGPGIADPRLALEGRISTTGTLGAGLSGARRLADEMDLDVRLGQGSCVWARKFAQPGARRREVGVFGRPCEGEIESGDHAAFVRTGGALALALADGLGHGPPAFLASSAAIGAFARAPERDLLAILGECHAALASTRGAVMSIARVDDEAHELATAAVGNVSTHIERPRESRRFAGPSAVLGAPGLPPKPKHVERTSIDAREAVLLFSDGLFSRATASEEAGLFVEHPIVVAQWMLETFGRDNDDVLVLVAR